MSTAAARGANRRVPCSWKLDSSATNTSPAGRPATHAMGGSPMLPTVRACSPEERSSSQVSVVVVVLPLVPVMASQSRGLSRHASSGSLTSSAQRRAAAA